MKQKVGIHSIFAWVFLGAFLAPIDSPAKTTPQTETHVTLLGQSCLLRGPFDEATLMTIHAIGPAQIYPNISTSDAPKAKALTQKALEQIRKANSLPSLLDRYREKLGKRLEAQIAFFSSFDSGKLEARNSQLTKAAKTNLGEDDFKKFQALLKKFQTLTKKDSTYKDQIEDLFSFYSNAIEQDPEKDFHSAIEKLNIQYACSFEETEE